MKLYITGIAGFIGSHLDDACIARGDEVSGNDSLICGDRTNVPAKAKFKACLPGWAAIRFIKDELKGIVFLCIQPRRLMRD